MILLKKKAYLKTKWSLDLTLLVGKCPKVLIIAKIPKQEAQYHEQLEDQMKLNAHMGNNCTINFFESFLVCSVDLFCYFVFHFLLCEVL